MIFLVRREEISAQHGFVTDPEDHSIENLPEVVPPQHDQSTLISVHGQQRWKAALSLRAEREKALSKAQHELQHVLESARKFVELFGSTPDAASMKMESLCESARKQVEHSKYRLFEVTWWTAQFIDCSTRSRPIDTVSHDSCSVFRCHRGRTRDASPDRAIPHIPSRGGLG
jgi:hypothetical protein